TDARGWCRRRRRRDVKAGLQTTVGAAGCTLIPPAGSVGLGSVNNIFELDHGLRPVQKGWMVPATLVSMARGFGDEEIDVSTRMPQSAKMAFSYPPSLGATGSSHFGRS